MKQPEIEVKALVVQLNTYRRRSRFMVDSYDLF